MMLGKTVLYRCRPGQVRMGARDMAAIVTREQADGCLDLMIFPPKTHIGDALHYENVAPMTDVYTGHCWHPVEEPVDRMAEAAKRGPGRPPKSAAA